MEYVDGEPPKLLLSRAPNSYEIQRWLSLHGVNYDGLYWESLTKAERCPPAAPSSSGGGHASGGTRSGGGTGIGAIDYSSGGDASVVWARSGGMLAQAAAQQQLLQHWTASQAAQLQAFYLGTGQNMATHPAWSFGLLGVSAPRPEPRPDLKREMHVGEIVAHRCWRLSRGFADGLRLMSVVAGDIWVPGETLVGRELEDWGERGIHAWKAKGPDFARYAASNSSYCALVVGTVFLWGDVVEHELGYRAQYARVRSIDWLMDNSAMEHFGREAAVLEELRDTYGTP